MLATPRDVKYVDFIEKLIGNKLNRRSMTDIEVREDCAPRRDQHKGRDRNRDRGGKRHDRRPPDGKFHDQVAGTDPVREAQVAASAPNPAILDAPLTESRPERRHEAKVHEARAHDSRAHEPKVHEAKAYEPRPHRGKKPHGKPPRQGTPEKEPVDKSQLPAFLFRKVRLPQD